MIKENPILTAAEKLDIISKNSVEGVIIINDTGSIEEWNDYLVDKTGYSKVEISGKKIWDVQHRMLTKEWQKIYSPGYLKNSWMNFIHDLRDNEYITKEGQFLARNKEIIFTEDIICRINLQNKNYLYVIQRDRGLRRKVEDADVMTSIVLFELKSLISSLLDFSELFNSAERKVNLDKLLNFIQQITLSSEHTIKLLENLLVFISVQNGKMEFTPGKINLSQIFEDILREFKSRFSQKKIELNYLVKSEISCTADAKLLKIILRNLTDNALKYTRAGGKVVMSASVNNDFVEVEISDNGVGIDHATMKKLFLSGSKISTSGARGEKGSGLGLIVCRNLVEKQGGKIWVRSEPGKGSSFIFTIPCS